MESDQELIPNLNLPDLHNCSVAVIGLGYVGLPLAVEFAKSQKCLETGNLINRRVLGFDINEKRLEELRKGIDKTNETDQAGLREASKLDFSSDESFIINADVFIITVPTPIDTAKQPDLSPIEGASKIVGKALKRRQENNKKTIPIIIFESTVYPGATEEVCIPIIEEISGLAVNQDFGCGYSPERINPGDTEHKLTTITKVTSGSSPQISIWVDKFYGSIIKAGTHLAPSIKIAEAAKVIENTQRDLNIALINELAIIFQKMNIDTLDVLEAAGTKWNFLPFRPGLVGGHCISVDPYYLTHKAEKLGYLPQVVLAGRRINNDMGKWVVQQLVMEMTQRGIAISGSNVLVLGLAFKENCPDIRNTGVMNVVNELKKYGMKPDLIDPWVDPEEARKEYGLLVKKELPRNDPHDVVFIAVAHKEFTALSRSQWEELITLKGIFFDLKGITPRELNPIRL